MSKYLRKNSYTEKSGRSKQEAIETALKELGAEADDVIIEVIDEGSKGFLGIGSRDARVKVTLKNAPAALEEDEAEEEAAPAVKQEIRRAPKQRPAKRTAQTRESIGTPKEDAEKFLADIFKAMKLDVEISTEFDAEDNALNIELTGENMGIIIGKRGDTIDSIQYLTSLVVNQRSQDYIKVSIDTENYREKRTDALIALSNRLADKVARSGRKFTLEPMNPYERRVIHSNLQNSETVTTYSVGSEPYRKVVIAPKNAKPYGGKKRDNRKPRSPHRDKPVAEKTGSYTTTYKADFKPPVHKAEYKSFDDYLAAQESETETNETEE